ncbi:guanylate kinase [uncultured Eubacterium sp.]|uniref:guanylate kinase n=1 Tax=uncultured Eubacterium sp. TaxID=165185 RepID=UPI0025F80EFD|nr:guanylate kinase [uncultured Eubacterium sp.]
MADSGFLIVISGFSGSGKGTIMKELIARYPDEYALSISATTRGPREGEQNGREYFFKTKEEFLTMIENGQLLEHAQYVENYYGTPKAYVEEQLQANKNVILEIEIQGALKIKEQFPQTLLLFVTPPSAQILKDRLTGRGTETEEVINSRLSRAIEEADGCEVYDYLVINDELDEAVEHVHQIIRSEHQRMQHNLNTIETIKNDLKQFVKGDLS